MRNGSIKLPEEFPKNAKRIQKENEEETFKIIAIRFSRRMTEENFH